MTTGLIITLMWVVCYLGYRLHEEKGNARYWRDSDIGWGKMYEQASEDWYQLNELLTKKLDAARADVESLTEQLSDARIRAIEAERELLALSQPISETKEMGS